MTIDEMNLDPVARWLSYNNIPMCGRRTVKQHAHAMAGNIVELKDRKLDR